MMRILKVISRCKGSTLPVLATLLAACGQAETTDPEPAPRPVKLHVVEDFSDQFSTSFPAVMEASRSAQLAFQVGGLLQELPVTESQEVAEGELIAKLDQRDFQNQYNSAKAQYDNAVSEYQRARRLAEQNAISQSVLEQRLSQRDITKAQLDTAKKALDDTELRAPYDGFVAEVMVENFQNVSPQQAIVAFQSGGDIEAVINVPARLIAYVPQLEPVEPVVTLDVAPELRIPAAFKEATGQADPTTQTYRVHFTFSPPEDFLILPGMTGSVATTFLYSGDRFDGGVSIPLSAILVSGDEKYVWVIDQETMKAEKRQVTLAEEQIGETATIMTGLTSGEVIAGAGASYLHDGMTVREWTN